MEATTIKIHESTKNALDKLGAEQETYDETISRLIDENKKKHLVKELIAGYKAKAKEDKAAVKEWDAVSAEID